MYGHKRGVSTVNLDKTHPSAPTFTAPKVTNNEDLTFTLMVTDGQGNTERATEKITVKAAHVAPVTTPGNTPPVADAGGNQAVKTGDTVTLNGSKSTDADNDPLTYVWLLVGKPAGSNLARFLTLTGSQPTFTADVDGEYQFQLTVNDKTVNSVPDSVTITAVAPPSTNTPPVANAGPDQVVITGRLVTLDGRGSTDDDGDTLTYHWNIQSVPSGSKLLSATFTGSPMTFTPDVDGDYVIQLTVDDLHNATTDEVQVKAVALKDT